MTESIIVAVISGGMTLLGVIVVLSERRYFQALVKT